MVTYVMDRITPQMHEILNIKNIQLLHDKQIYTVLDFVSADVKLIEKITELSFKDIQDIRKSFLKKYSPQPKSAFDYYKNIPTQHAIIETGIKNVDNLLEGGLFTGNIYEIYGSPASGKTQFCLTLLKNSISKFEHNIYYLDTKFDFSGLKLKRMLSSLNKAELIEALNRVFVQRIATKYDLFNSLHELKEKLQNGFKMKLLVIDSLSVLYMQSTDLDGNNGFLSHLASNLNYLVNEFNIVVIVTNLLMRWNEGDFINTDVLKERIACGKYWQDVPHVRLKMEKDEDKITVTLVKTIKVIPPINYCEIKLTEHGLV